MKLVIDDACYGFEKIFGVFGDIVAMPGRNISSKTVKDADILIVRSRTKVNKDLLFGSKIRFVGSTVAGLDHIDLQYLQKNKIQLFSAQGCNAMAVAEFVISALVNLSDDLNFDLSKKTLGIVGVGNVGLRLAAKAKIMGIKTILNDPLRRDKEKLANFKDLNAALGADIVTFHTPLTFSGKYPTYKLLNENNFSLIKENTILINAARGGIIDENIWQKTKTLANVIDCWEDEPNINQSLQHSAYLATPHIAGHSIDAKFMGSFMIYQSLCDYFDIKQDKEIKNSINPKKMLIEKNNLKDTLNQIYSFAKDDKAIKDISNFENYRRHYPLRYQWQHFDTKISLPM